MQQVSSDFYSLPPRRSGDGVKAPPPRWGIALFDKRRSTTEGLTLMECIVAITVVALTGALIPPPLFLAAATRVQNRRSEQALQIAQGEIDRIRTLVEQGEHSENNIPEAVTEDNFPPAAPDTIENVIRTFNATCTNRPLFDNSNIPVNALLPIDVDGDCSEDFYLQSFRTSGSRLTDTKPSDFDVGVRVYSRSVIGNGGQLRALQTEQASLRFTSGEGSQRQLPLAVLYTRATWDGSGVALYCYHNADVCNE